MRIASALVASLVAGCGSSSGKGPVPASAGAAPAAPAVAAPPAPAPVAPPLAARGRFPTGDFDGDGLADLAFTAVERPGEQCQQEKHGKTCWRPQAPSRMLALVFLGRDRGRLSQTIELATGPDDLKMGRAYEVGAVGDLDGDGRTEIAITFHPRGIEETLLLLRGTPRGLSDPYQSVKLPKVESHYWYSLRARPAGDVGGDGHPDIVLGAAILHGSANGEIATVELVKPPNYSPYEFTMTYPVGDATGDGVADVVAVHRNQTWLLPRGGATGAVSLAIPATYPTAFEAADLDGDGKAELVSIVPGGGRLRVTIHAVSTTGATPGAWIDIPADEVHGVVVADTDGSGIRDIHVVASIGRVDVPCATKCTGPANRHVRTVRVGKTLVLDPRPPVPAGFVQFGTGPEIYLRALGDLDGDGVEELAIVEDGKLRATRSRGGTLAIDAHYARAPKQIDVYTARAN